MTKLRREVSEDSLRQIGARSEYVKRFQVYPLQKTQSCKPPADIVRSNEPIDSVTVQKRDYPAHPLEKRTAARPAPGNIKSEGEHDFRSSYRDQYLDQPLEVRRPFKPVSERPDLGAFDAKPSYNSDYPEWQLPDRTPRQRIEWNPPTQPFVGESTNLAEYPAHQVSPRVKHRQKGEWNPPEQPFGGESTSFAEYPAHQVSPRVHHRPDNKPVHSDLPFMASSDYKDTFKVHDVQPRVKREKESWSKPVEPFDATTTQQRDFTGQYGTPQRSMRPDREPFMSDAPLNSETTAKASYVPFDLPKRYRHEPEAYKRPDGNMDLTTTNNTHFTSHSVQRLPIEKPGSSQILRGKGPMSNGTSYMDSFVGSQGDRVANMKPKQEYQHPSIPMESNTVNKNDFLEHQITPRQSYGPSREPMISDQPFDDRTDYKDQFKQKDIPPRHVRAKEVFESSKVPLDTRTTAQDAYKGAYQPKREAYNPNRNPVMSSDPFEAQTTMNNDFKKHDIARRQMLKPEEYKKPEGTMDLATTHTTNFTPHSLTRHAIHKPGSSGLLRGQGEMSKETNYQGDFYTRPIDRVKIMKPEHWYEPPTQPMDTTTTNQTIYSEKDFSKRQSFKPTTEMLMSDVPLDTSTGYRDQFPKHEIAPRKMRPKETYQPTSAPLDTRTTARDSYVGAVQPKRDSFRPNQSYVRADVPVDSSTTAASSFKAWPAEKRYIHKPNEYVKPEGVMDLSTSNRETYKAVQGERPAMRRLGSSHLLSYGGKFEANTSYQGDYIPKQIEGRKSNKPSQEYVPPTVPFDGHTEYRSALVGYVAPKQKSFKPGNAMSDTLGQREVNNPYRAKEPDWRDMLNMSAETTRVA